MMPLPAETFMQSTIQIWLLGAAGGHLSEEAAITRLVGAILLEQNDEWAVPIMMAENVQGRLSENAASDISPTRCLDRGWMSAVYISHVAISSTSAVLENHATLIVKMG
jgi:hypothetical protein